MQRDDALRDALAARYSEPAGLTSRRVYNTDESPIPNETGRTFVEAFNDGALLLKQVKALEEHRMKKTFLQLMDTYGYRPARSHSGWRKAADLLFLPKGVCANKGRPVQC